jgi:hypothetical protein
MQAVHNVMRFPAWSATAKRPMLGKHVCPWETDLMELLTMPERDNSAPAVTPLPTISVQESGWPLSSYLELGALPTAVPCARLHVKQMLWEWNLGMQAETAELIVSELVTNAVHASVGLTGSWFAGRWAAGMPPARLWLSSDRHRIMIQVWDGNHQMPTRQDVGFDEESGRGLLLVESLSAGWGAYAPERSSGKVVWAVVTNPQLDRRGS